MPVAERRRTPAVLYGSAKPRIAPPTPARSRLADFRALATSLGIKLYPWQETAARYLTALGPGDRWLYPEVAIVAARQNGKTELLKLLIIGRLLDGQRIMHTAQDRQGIVREVFAWVAEYMWEHHSELFAERNGRRVKPRYANGQEEIRLANGAIYSIVSPTRGGARGPSRDLVIIDEARQLASDEFIAAAEPTQFHSENPQTVYLSNAGHEGSVVLNAIKARAGEDPALAYLEWSAEPHRATDDVTGWLESNPAVGHFPPAMSYLERKHQSHSLAGTLHIFNTEHLCRWVTTDLPSLVPQVTWDASRRSDLGKPQSPVIGVSLDPSGKRASIALAWQDADGIAVRLIGDVTGDPIDADLLGQEVKAHAAKLGVMLAGYDPETDALLAKYLRKPETIVGAKWTAACSRFATLAESGKLRWEGPDAMSEDNRWAARLTDPADGTFRVVKAKDDHPITSILAAIRAVWLASGPPRIRPKVL